MKIWKIQSLAPVYLLLLFNKHHVSFHTFTNKTALKLMSKQYFIYMRKAFSWSVITLPTDKVISRHQWILHVVMSRTQTQTRNRQNKVITLLTFKSLGIGKLSDFHVCNVRLSSKFWITIHIENVSNSVHLNVLEAIWFLYFKPTNNFY